MEGFDFAGADVVIDESQIFEAFDFGCDLIRGFLTGGLDDGPLSGCGEFGCLGEHGGKVLFLEDGRVEESEDIACFQGCIAEIVIVAAIFERLIYYDSQGCGGEKAVGVQEWRGDGFDDEVCFEKDSIGLSGFPDTENRVAGFHSENGIQGGENQWMVGSHKSDVLTGQGATALESDHRSLGGQTGKCGRLGSATFEQIAPQAEFFHLDSQVVEHANEGGLKIGIGVLTLNRFDEGSGDLRAVGIEFQKPVVTTLQAFGDFFRFGGGFFDQCGEAT